MVFIEWLLRSVALGAIVQAHAPSWHDGLGRIEAVRLDKYGGCILIDWSTP